LHSLSKAKKGVDRMFYLSEYEHVSNTIPGPGNYNPRLSLPKLHENKMNPENGKKNTRTILKTKEKLHFLQWDHIRKPFLWNL